MSLLPIRTYPDPILKQAAVEVTQFNKELQTLLDNMAETMYHGQGIGLAGPQVAVLKRVIVVDISSNRQERIDFVNPRIVFAQGKVSCEEGCLSVPEYRDTVSRAKEIVVQACNGAGKEFELRADGLLAVCIQHEIDHLDGILFIDRLSRLKREMFKRWLKKQAAA